MKAYVSKPVLTCLSAMPMTWAAYKALRGWNIEISECDNDDGYLVEQVVGSPELPNHKDFKGYIYWLTKEEFEDAFVEVTNI